MKDEFDLVKCAEMATSRCYQNKYINYINNFELRFDLTKKLNSFLET